MKLKGENKKNKSKTHKDIFESFKEREKDLCERYDINLSLFREVSKKFNELLVEALIEDAYEYNMGSNLGKLSIKKKEINRNKLKIDYKETKRLGETVYHLNEHSDFSYFVFSWAKGNVSNIRFFRFVPIKKNKQKLTTAIRNKTIKHS